MLCTLVFAAETVLGSRGLGFKKRVGKKRDEACRPSIQDGVRRVIVLIVIAITSEEAFFCQGFTNIDKGEEHAQRRSWTDRFGRRWSRTGAGDFRDLREEQMGYQHWDGRMPRLQNFSTCVP